MCKKQCGGPICTLRKLRECIFCDSEGHNSSECLKFLTLEKRRAILLEKGLSCICAKSHPAAKCPEAQAKCSDGCQKTGHSLVTYFTHTTAVEKRSKKEREETFESSGSQLISGIQSGMFLQTVTRRLNSTKVVNTPILVRGLLDHGSALVLVDKFLVGT